MSKTTPKSKGTDVRPVKSENKRKYECNIDGGKTCTVYIGGGKLNAKDQKKEMDFLKKFMTAERMKEFADAEAKMKEERKVAQKR